jgi:hypothetical protein
VHLCSSVCRCCDTPPAFFVPRFRLTTQRWGWGSGAWRRPTLVPPLLPRPPRVAARPPCTDRAPAHVCRIRGRLCTSGRAHAGAHTVLRVTRARLQARNSALARRRRVRRPPAAGLQPLGKSARPSALAVSSTSSAWVRSPPALCAPLTLKLCHQTRCACCFARHAIGPGLAARHTRSRRPWTARAWQAPPPRPRGAAPPRMLAADAASFGCPRPARGHQRRSPASRGLTLRQRPRGAPVHDPSYLLQPEHCAPRYRLRPPLPCISPSHQHAPSSALVPVPAAQGPPSPHAGPREPPRPPAARPLPVQGMAHHQHLGVRLAVPARAHARLAHGASRCRPQFSHSVVCDLQRHSFWQPMNGPGESGAGFGTQMALFLFL